MRRYIKENYKGQGSQLDYNQVAKLVRALNIMFELQEMDLEAMGEEGGIGGNSGKDYLSEEEENKIYRKLKNSQIYSKDRTHEIEYLADYRLTWELLSLSEIVRFLKRNRHSFKTETPH